MHSNPLGMPLFIQKHTLRTKMALLLELGIKTEDSVPAIGKWHLLYKSAEIISCIKISQTNLNSSVFQLFAESPHVKF